MLKSNVYFWSVFDKIPQSFPKIGNYGQFQLRDLIIPFEKGLSKLSENHKIIVIRPTELKLWPFKDALLYADYMNTVY